jgi:TRAP-type uncharacterized transport system substrate-binding protein
LSFDVHLIASSQTPVGEDWTTALRKALARHGISDRKEGITATVGDGGQADIYAGDQSVMFAVYGGFTAGVVHLVYEVASALRMFIIPAGDEEIAYRTSGNEGNPPDDFFSLESVKDVADLHAVMLR